MADSLEQRVRRLEDRFAINDLVVTYATLLDDAQWDALGQLFTEDGVYHDVFYGDFKGHQKIAEMIDDWFHRTARDFRWDMHRPLSDGKMLYAYYTFSYVSKLPEAKGKRVGFEGCSMMVLRDGKIADYREVANVGPAFVELGFAPERTSKILAKEGAHLKAQPEWKRHLA